MKEVISIPASRTQDIIKEYLIHAHPHPRSYKDAQFMTFRKVGGYMDALYSVQHELIIKPRSNGFEDQLEYLRDDFKKRLLGYIRERKHGFGFGEKDEYKFYFLKVEQSLDHLPKPIEGNGQSHTYYTYEEIISGKSEIIRESVLNKRHKK
ncbi:hypothetical protein QGM71_20750 [Virgibacillus sp. C22-A2]|uniref:Uncharacterized protein n=1 Tax=Virgibacillus tibetensis TaxID=3042313 RepID=A0ABU6KKR7_9BACI|nr:hypothetical protein [Virgibacillus sp. C22-A2]